MTRRLQPLDLSRDSDADRIEERPAAGALRWTPILTWFMRAVAVLWIVKGLSAWAAIVGAGTDAGFEGRSTGYQATMIYFAVIDPVAAVGLWMASTWGGVLWLLAVMSHLILAMFFPQIVSMAPAVMALVAGLMVTYLVISWLSAREEQ
ncbi:MAG TPA: DUF6163 family protein [Microvirga sp.]|nr:DUF6163 family protein [Microvirga sp.]